MRQFLLLILFSCCLFCLSCGNPDVEASADKGSSQFKIPSDDEFEFKIGFGTWQTAGQMHTYINTGFLNHGGYSVPMQYRHLLTEKILNYYHQRAPHIEITSWDWFTTEDPHNQFNQYLVGIWLHHNKANLNDDEAREAARTLQKLEDHPSQAEHDNVEPSEAAVLEESQGIDYPPKIQRAGASVIQ